MNDSIALLDVVSYTLQYGMEGTIDALDTLSDTMTSYATVDIPGRGDSVYTAPSVNIPCTYCVDGTYLPPSSFVAVI